MKRWKIFAVSIAIPLAVGGLAALLTRQGVAQLPQFNQPALMPPSWLFGVVWTALYTLMGISAGIVYQKSPKDPALVTYGAQLAVNFLWTLLFFNLQAFLLSFFWLLLLFALIVLMVLQFLRLSRTAALLQLPYLAWTAFASYLNLAFYLLNR